MARRSALLILLFVFFAGVQPAFALNPIGDGFDDEVAFGHAVKTDYEKSLGIESVLEGGEEDPSFDEEVPFHIRSSIDERNEVKQKITQKRKARAEAKMKLETQRLTKVRSEIARIQKLREAPTETLATPFEAKSWLVSVLFFLSLTGLFFSFRKGSKLMNYLDK